MEAQPENSDLGNIYRLIFIKTNKGKVWKMRFNDIVIAKAQFHQVQSYRNTSLNSRFMRDTAIFAMINQYLKNNICDGEDFFYGNDIENGADNFLALTGCFVK